MACRVREGLPRDADDAHMVEPVRAAEVFQAEFVAAPRRPRAGGGASAAEEGSRAASEERADGGGGGGEEDTDEGGDERKVVAALAELDDSDAEPECKSGSTYDEFGVRYPNKPMRLWRTARDRATWLADLRRAELTGSLDGAAFCAAILLDRSQPLTVRLANFARAARERQAVEEVAAADEGGTAVDGGEVELATDAGLGLRSSKRPRHSIVAAIEAEEAAEEALQRPAGRVRFCPPINLQICGPSARLCAHVLCTPQERAQARARAEDNEDPEARKWGLGIGLCGKWQRVGAGRRAAVHERRALRGDGQLCGRGQLGPSIS